MTYPQTAPREEVQLLKGLPETWRTSAQRVTSSSAASRVVSRVPYAPLYVIGAHGGAGESTIASLNDQWIATERRWPYRREGGRKPRCVLVARTNAAGLLSARQALQWWAFDASGVSVELLGLVLNADAPGRLPRALRDLADLVSGGAPRQPNGKPRVWRMPWNESWRQGNPVMDHPGSVALDFVSDIRSLTASAADAVNPR